MFTPKQVPYRMRDSSLLEQSHCRTTTFGLRSISYNGAKLWNDLPTYLKETTSLSDFKMILQTWTGPDLNDPFRSYVWAPSDSLYKSEISFVSYIESCFYTPPLYVHCITALCRLFYYGSLLVTWYKNIFPQEFFFSARNIFLRKKYIFLHKK